MASNVPIDFTGDSDEADAALKRQLEEAERASAAAAAGAGSSQ